MKKLLALVVICLWTALQSVAQQPDSVFVKQHYDKMEVQIAMRDGIKLFTTIYSPKDKSRTYPILMNRTCYGVEPYGATKYEKSLGPSPYLMRDGYIFVYQDVRGRWMSEGVFDNMTPNIPGNDRKNKTAID